MKLLWRIVVPVACVALTGGAAVTWHFLEARATQRKLVEGAKACRVRAEQGEENAQYDLGRLYYQGKGVTQDYSQALSWYRKAAEQGNAKAQYGVGYMYYSGLGETQDYAQAFTWYRKAAEQGNAKAQYDLAFMYHEGKGVSRDLAEALNWCRKAADQGDVKAEYVVGITYFEGKEVPQDYTESFRWHRKAADQGYREAESNLGYLYYQGKGTWQDYAQAAYWYRKAASQGDDYARRALSSMGIPFSPLSKIILPVVFLFSVVLLLPLGKGFRSRQERIMIWGGLLGLLCVGLDVYGHFQFGTLLAFSAVNVFYLGRGILSGTFISILARIAWPGGFKVVLAAIGILFVGFNVYAALHYDLRHFGACPRAFYSTNGRLIGMAIAFAILRRGQREPTDETPNDNHGMASGALPLGM